jgi:CPA1 family monovalent cation:H+ antiporter
LTRRLRVLPPDPAEDALARATLLQQAAIAGLARLEEDTTEDPHGVRDVIRTRLDQRTFAAWERLGTAPGIEAPSEAYARLRRSMIEAERARVLEIRSQGKVASDVVREVLGMLDIEESMIEAAAEERSTVTTDLVAAPGDECAELEGFPATQTNPEPVCLQCVADGTQPVALRECLACGHIGCCDSSPGMHATAHFETTGHPVMQSAEPGEAWRWCYVHHLTA